MQVDTLIKRMDIRTHNDFATRAALQGRKVPFKRLHYLEAGPDKRWTEEEHKTAEKAAASAHKRLVERAKMRQRIAKKRG